eukprot:1375886-Amorphochlora_amoeboformis.AAC.1
MSERIKHLHVHMRANHKDKHSMYGINALINKRRYMLKYLAKKDYKSFKGLVEEYEISTLEIMTVSTIVCFLCAWEDVFRVGI